MLHLSYRLLFLLHTPEYPKQPTHRFPSLSMHLSKMEAESNYFKDKTKIWIDIVVEYIFIILIGDRFIVFYLIYDRLTASFTSFFA